MATLYRGYTGTTLADATDGLFPGQQNQVTGSNGLYMFDVLPGQYRIVITPPQGYTFPSVLIPPETTPATGGPVVPNALPNIAGDTTYHFTFDVTLAGGEITNNHIPLDPLGKAILLKLEKEANKKEAVIGDIITYTIKIQTAAGATFDVDDVKIVDTIPPNFKYLKGTTLINKEKAPDPSGDRRLTFAIGRVRVRVETTLSYQLVVGSGVIPGEYENVAVAQKQDRDISNRDEAEVEITLDPLFDQGTIIGKVFWDNDWDGYCDKGERGIEGVMVAMEDGTIVYTDQDGKYHFKAIDPDTRVIKLNRMTLPQGSILTTPESYFVDITNGILAKVNFGVGYEEAEVREIEEPLVVTGDLYKMEAFVNRHPVELLLAEARLKSIKYIPEDDSLQIELTRVFFDTDESKLRPEGKERLDRAVKIIAAYPELEVMVVGSTDHRASKEYNRWLGMQRAKAVEKYLIERGIDPTPITTRSVGEELPMAVGKTEKDMQLNRNAAAIRMAPYFSEKEFEVKEVILEDAIWFRDGQLNKEVFFTLDLKNKEDISEWVLNITDPTTNRACKVFSGQGQPPDRITFDGRDWQGKPLEAARVYTYQLYIKGRDAQEAWSPERFFGVNQEKIFSISLTGALFDTDRSELRPEAKERLKGIARELKGYPERPIVIEGHTDYRASDDYNFYLGLARARAVRDYLIEMEGIPADRLIAISYGEQRPIAAEKTKEAMQQNRRVQIKTLGRIEERTKIQQPTYRPHVEINGAEVVIREDGSFEEAFIRDEIEKDLVTIDMRDQEGRRSRAVVLVPSIEILSPKGRIKLEREEDTPICLIRGETEPGNRVSINNEEVRVLPDGIFEKEVTLREGENTYLVVATNPSGYTHSLKLIVTLSGKEAVLRELVKEVRDHFFLVGIADYELGQIEAEGYLEGVEHDHHFQDGFYQEGRLAYYLTGKIKGKYLITSSLDTARDEKRAALFRNLDPNKYYPIYGDSSRTVYDGQSKTRGPFYLLLGLNESSLVYGNYQTNLTGTDFGQYHRTLYGAKLDLRTVSRTRYGDPDTEFIIFGSKLEQARAHLEFRGTGGSLYYLKDENIIEGSEKVRLEVRDKDSGLVIEQLEAKQNIDYTINYDAGRILFKRPVHSVVESASLIDDEILGGNPVYVIVNYEYEVEDLDSLKAGGRIKRQLGDHIGVGVTYLSEDREDEDFELIGGDLTIKAGRETELAAEYGRSRSEETDRWMSDNGGLSFLQLPSRDDEQGEAYRFVVRTDVADWVGRDGDWIEMSGYYRMAEEGFSSRDRDSKKYGGQIGYHIDEKNRIIGGHQVHETLSSGLRRDTTTVRSEHKIGRLTLTPEYKIEASDGEHTQTAAARLRARITKRMSASVEQQVTLEGEENNQTTLGLEAELTDRVTASATHTIGDKGSSSLLDIRREDTSGSISLSKRITEEANTTIVGADRRITSWSKAYSQYEIASSIDGQTNRKILGLDNTWRVGKGTTIDLDYKHSHTEGEEKDTRREVGAVGIEYLKQDRMKTSLRVEGRRDVGDQEKTQAIVTSCFNARLTEALSILAGFDWSQTANITTEMVEAKLQELNLGLALRPTRYDWLNLLAKYTNTVDQRPITLTGEDPYEIIVDTYSLEAVLDLTQRWQLVEKVANRLRREVSEARGRTRGETQLWINRLNYHIHHKWDAALEYRLLRQIQADDLRSGFRAILYRHIMENLRLGVGYNFTDFKDLQFDENDYSAKGWLIRLQGRL